MEQVVSTEWTEPAVAAMLEAERRHRKARQSVFGLPVLVVLLFGFGFWVNCRLDSPCPTVPFLVVASLVFAYITGLAIHEGFFCKGTCRHVQICVDRVRIEPTSGRFDLGYWRWEEVSSISIDPHESLEGFKVLRFSTDAPFGDREHVVMIEPTVDCLELQATLDDCFTPGVASAEPVV